MGNNCCGGRFQPEVYPEIERCKSGKELLMLIERKKCPFEDEANEIQLFQENPIKIPVIINPANFTEDELEEKKNVSTRIVQEFLRASNLITQYEKKIKLDKLKRMLNELFYYSNERDDLSMKYLIDEFIQYSKKHLNAIGNK